MSAPSGLNHPDPQPASALYQSPGPASIPLWIQHLPDPMAQHGIVSEFAHHPTSMAKVESRGPFAGETKLDVWLFKHSKFLRKNFKNGMQHTEASGTVFLHEEKSRYRSDTTGSGEEGAEPRAVAAESAESPDRGVKGEDGEDENEGGVQRLEEQEKEQEQEQEQDDGIRVGEEAPGHAVNTVKDVNLRRGTRLRRGTGGVKKGMRWAFWYDGKE